MSTQTLEREETRHGRDDYRGPEIEKFRRGVTGTAPSGERFQDDLYLDVIESVRKSSSECCRCS